MKRRKITVIVCSVIAICFSMLFCGLTTLALQPQLEETEALLSETVTEPNEPEPEVSEPDTEDTTPEPKAEAAAITEQPINPPQPQSIQETHTELFPTDVERVIEDAGRQIIRTYILYPGQCPSNIPRDSFERDGWLFALTDITQRRTTEKETRHFTKTVEIRTDTNNLNEIIPLLYPTIEYHSEDGFFGVLSLDISSVNCEIEGRETRSFTATATRTYPNLSASDVSLIPRTITENGRTLSLASVSWEVQSYTNVDYHNIPNSFRAVATYSANAARTVITGYITTAEYSGEITREIPADIVYTAFFSGTEITPQPQEIYEPAPHEQSPEETEPVPHVDRELSDEPLTTGDDYSGERKIPILPGLAVLMLISALAGIGAYIARRRNVKVYENNFSTLIAKDRINSKNKKIDLSPLQGIHFGIEIEKGTAKHLNGQALDIRHGDIRLSHTISYEGNVYRIDVDLAAGVVRAVY